MNRYVNLDEATGLFIVVDVKMVGSFVAYMLESLPTIDIVYCEDCKYFRTGILKVGGTYNGCGVWIDDGNEIEVEPNQFCSYGERIDNE